MITATIARIFRSLNPRDEGLGGESMVGFRSCPIVPG
jgi:hypothetical protein